MPALRCPINHLHRSLFRSTLFAPVPNPFFWALAHVMGIPRLRLAPICGVYTTLEGSSPRVDRYRLHRAPWLNLF